MALLALVLRPGSSLSALAFPRQGVTVRRSWREAIPSITIIISNREAMMSTMTIERPTATDLRKIRSPKNRVLGRLKEQVLAGDSKDTTVAYSRMHNRHNRS